MSSSDFDKHKVDHLFLLIGENPLPNYVAANLLLNKGGTVYLVYTTNTKTQKDRLKNILGSELGGSQLVDPVSLDDNESDAYYIQKAIADKIQGLKGRLGLNYTGGTKAMAVHSYRAVFSKQRPDTVFSYLDPRRLEMCIDNNENGDRFRIRVKPEVLEVKLEKLFQIHGWTWKEKSKPIYEPELPDAAKAFAEFHAEENLIHLWRNWCDRVLREATKKKSNKNKWLSETELQKLPDLSLQVEIENEVVNLLEYPPINKALNTLGITGSDLSLKIIQSQGVKKIESVCKWLDGEWLEYYVLKQVQNIAPILSIHDSATSFWIANQSDPNNIKFQFDVAFMRGYQLFAISCTTIEHKFECKSKLFEAYIRAQQLGGSEARVALVCCANSESVKALETEITNVFKSTPDGGNKDYKLAVFGRDDLTNLSEKIADWVRKNEEQVK